MKMVMETDDARSLRALAGLLHGVDDLLTPAELADLETQPDSRDILALARVFHAPSATRPPWAHLAHHCASWAQSADHLSVPQEAITGHVLLSQDRPRARPSYLQAYPMPDPGDTIEDLCPTPDRALAAATIARARQRLGAALGDVVRQYTPGALPTAIAAALDALRAYAWGLPAHSADCALYEHARLCAAAAACLPDEPGDRPFLLLHGDLSGIQRFIFDTAQAAGGPARRLRARSAALLLLMETVAHHILHECAVPLPNLLATTAGHIYVLLPADGATTARLATIRRRVARWLRDTYGGELALHMVWREVSANDLLPCGPDRPGCGDLMRALAVQIGDSKSRPLVDALQDAGAWDEAAFLLEAPPTSAEICVACRHRPAQQLAGTAPVCALCHADYRLGSVLPTARALAFYRDDELYTQATSSPVGGVIALLPPYSVQALRPGDQPVGRPYLVAPFTRTAANVFAAAGVPALQRHVITRVPHDRDGVPRTFDDLAQEARYAAPNGGLRGAPYLGYLRADIDRLGAIFAGGLRDEHGSHDGLAHILMLSRTLEEFMSGWLQHLLIQEYPDVYPVFGGGDDLILIGPWDAIVALAGKLRADFARYTANPQMSLSAGIAIVSTGLPVPRAAEAAGHAEDLAKNGDDRDDRQRRGGRDSVAIFDAALAWTDLPAIERAVGILADSAAGVGSGFLHRLLYYGVLQRHYRRGDVNALRYKMWLAYDVGRNIRAARDVAIPVKEWCVKLVEGALTDSARADYTYLEVVARVAIILTRRGER